MKKLFTIYALECKPISSFYIGKTNSNSRVRFNNHGSQAAPKLKDAIESYRNYKQDWLLHDLDYILDDRGQYSHSLAAELESAIINEFNSNGRILLNSQLWNYDMSGRYKNRASIIYHNFSKGITEYTSYLTRGVVDLEGEKHEASRVIRYMVETLGFKEAKHFIESELTNFGE